MANNNQKSGGGGGSMILAIIIIVIFLGLIGSCSSGGSSKYEDDLNSGMEKYRNGEKMNKDEYNAVNNYLEWEDKQRDKTYDDWNN